MEVDVKFNLPISYLHLHHSKTLYGQTFADVETLQNIFWPLCAVHGINVTNLAYLGSL